MGFGVFAIFTTLCFNFDDPSCQRSVVVWCWKPFENQSTYKLGYITLVRIWDILYIAINHWLTVIPSQLWILSNLDTFFVCFKNLQKSGGETTLSWKWKKWGRTKRSFSKMLPSRKRTWQWKISTFNTSSKGSFSIVMLVIWDVLVYFPEIICFFFAQETFRSRYHLCSRGPFDQPWGVSELLVAYP